MKNWFKDWFASEYYLAVYAHRNELDANNLVKLITDNISIKDNYYVLDAACGNGRHSQTFAKMGCNVVGFDLSKQLLAEAKKQKYSNLNFLCADIRKVPLKKNFDIILNLFTSFGYFSSDTDNMLFIKYASSNIKQNGYLVFDYLNPAFVRNNLVNSSSKSINNLEITEKRQIKENRVEKEIIITDENNLHRFYESVHLYSYNQIVNMFMNYEFRVSKLFGNYFGDEYSEKDSERMIIIFEKT